MMHLHTRSVYSLLKGTLRPEQIVQDAIDAGMSAAAITDIDSLAGIMAFKHAAEKKGIKAVYGIETSIDGLNVVILARNDDGLLDLYHHKYDTEDVVVIFTGIHDALEKMVADQDEDLPELLESLRRYPHVYVAEAMMDVSVRRSRQPWLDEKLEKAGIKKVALSYILYENEEDSDVLRALAAIDNNCEFDDMRLEVGLHRHFRTHMEMEELYSPEALENVQKLEDDLNVTFTYKKSSLPVFRNRLGIDSKDFLIKLARAGLEKRLGGKVDDRYRYRLEYELSVITSMGFTDYFLIVYDMIRYAKSSGILVGPGRGSAAGSLTAWCLGITSLDPVANGLFFERFLNPERISMPDIDTDFPDDRRQQVLDYMKETYGSEHFAQIAAFSNLQAKAAIKDVGKAFDVPAWVLDKASRLIPRMPGITLQKTWDTVPAFRKLVESRPDLKKTYAMAVKVEGIPRHITQHAAGIVLSDQPVDNAAPLFDLGSDIHVTQFTMEYLEEVGLIKIDVLSLRNLTIIQKILDDIRERYGRTIDIYRLDMNDPATYELLGRGDTLGVFQLEKEGMRELLRKVRPKTFSDLAIVLALYRPGPMQEIDTYLFNRAHPDRIRWPHPALKPVLSETYGIMIYQEQIMEAARLIGGFSLAQADILRKAMSKKKADVMHEYRRQFIAGAKANGLDEQNADAVFTLMEKFSGYGFNKAHSYAYGMIAYAMAWLKANYPLSFYAAVLDGCIGSEEKTGQYLYECRKNHIEVLPPDLRKSIERYEIEDGGLRMPLSVIKGLGKAVYPKIASVQQTDDFTNPITTIAMLWASHIQEAQIRSLIDAGALDYTGVNRATLDENVVHILNYANVIKVDRDGQLFDFTVVHEPTLIRMKENMVERSAKEKAALGFYISEHPIASLRHKYPRTARISQIENARGFVSLIGRVCSLHPVRTKKGDLMAFVTFEDESGQTDLAIMPDLFLRQRELVTIGALLYITGRRDRPGSVLVKSMSPIKIE